jgi:hypothetical protein
MLEYVCSEISERKVRLFACACCRRLWHLMQDERNVWAVEAAERYADGLVSRRELKKARKAAWIPWLTSFEPYQEAIAAVQAVTCAGVQPQQSLCDLLRDVAGNPFTQVTVKPSWLRYSEGVAVKIAQAIYDEGHFEDLPILGDALEEAGCSNDALLEHCRQPGEHVRGCWLVDLLLGKT